MWHGRRPSSHRHGLTHSESPPRDGGFTRVSRRPHNRSPPALRRGIPSTHTVPASRSDPHPIRGPHRPPPPSRQDSSIRLPPLRSSTEPREEARSAVLCRPSHTLRALPGPPHTRPGRLRPGFNAGNTAAGSRAAIQALTGSGVAGLPTAVGGLVPGRSTAAGRRVSGAPVMCLRRSPRRSTGRAPSRSDTSSPHRHRCCSRQSC